MAFLHFLLLVSAVASSPQGRFKAPIAEQTQGRLGSEFFKSENVNKIKKVSFTTEIIQKI